MNRNIRYLLTCAVLLMTVGYGDCQTRLPAIVSDGVVLQRNAELKIWGWDAAGTRVTCSFMDNHYETYANDAGLWEVRLPKMNAGGPYVMTIKGTDTISVRDILIGDVWVCSGQSNMELTMRRAAPLYGADIAASKNDYIRYFAAPQTYNFNNPQNDYKGGKWQKPDPENVLNFGAIAYFFARELNLLYRVPIGIINTAIGGTPVEAWISEDAIKKFPVHYQEAQRFKDASLIRRIEQDDREKVLAWYSELGRKDEGHKDPGGKWYMPGISSSDWKTMKIPGYWKNTELGAINGVMWFRKEIELPDSMDKQPARLLLGRIIDADSVFVNGIFTGTTSYQYPPRRYEVAPGILKAGKNLIVIKVINNDGSGGFVPDKPYELIIGSRKINLEGDWQVRLGTAMKPTPGQTTIKYKPVGLFNAMISPLLDFSIKGVLWYQGESNADRAIEYRQLFPALINDWRSQWNQGDFPFLYVQLPNFQAAVKEPSESNWALLRESQLMTLHLPNTGMAVAIDVGEWNDIHPLNKLDVAKRLVAIARRLAYDDTLVVCSGPVYKSMQVKRNTIILTFDHVGNGLTSGDDKMLQEFAIAGSDKKFVWADAQIKKDKVIVSSPLIKHPLSVRYAWADNPENANLYNKEGLPASPFRTDNW